MKKHFEQAIAFDRDSPLNQRTGLGKKYNELVDEYNALEEKYNEAMEIEEAPADEIVSDGVTTDDQPIIEDKDTTGKLHKGITSLFGKNRG